MVGGACPGSEELQDLVEGRLGDAARVDLLAHVDGCAPCHDLVAELVRGSEVDAIASPEAEDGGEPPASRLVRGDAVGPFIVIDEIGAGAMGIVVSAYDPRLERKVAIKVVRPGRKDAAGQRARLLREAQAMAKLSHPHVITVFEVGLLGEDIFVAMELVDGGTLAGWLGEERRSWREVLALFARVGSGLAAAHRAGLIHRDFKPDNVLVGTDGRVRVTDFGLVGVAPTGPEARRSADELSLTGTGTLLGTPGYMAPEQHRGEPVDARADQFAFCVALHEALYRDRPFAGARYQELVDNVVAGRRAPTRDAGVPAHVRHVIARGLLPDRDDRYPSMDALLADLGRDSYRVRRRVALAASALALAGFGAFGLWQARDAHRQLCAGAEAQLAGVWDDGVKRAVRSSFLASQRPYAEASWREVSRRLDDQAAAWVGMHRDACHATRVRGEQSERVLDLRMACLARRRTELAALAAVLASADGAVVERSVSAAASLVDVAGCADVERLSTVMPPPEGTAARLQIAAVRGLLAAARAYERAGKYKVATTMVEPALVAAERSGYRPLQAEARADAGWVRFRAGDFIGAERALFGAVVAASGAGHVEVELDARIALVAVNMQLARYDEGLRSGELAAAILSRLRGDPRREARLVHLEGNIFEARGDYAEARTRFERVIAIRQQQGTTGIERSADGLISLANIEDRLGNGDAAVALYRRALAIQEELLGPDHPELAVTLNNLGGVLNTRHEIQAARAVLTRGLEIREKALGAEHLSVAASLINVADNIDLSGDHERAAAMDRRALAILDKKSPGHPYAAFAHDDLAEARASQGEYDDALREARSGLDIREKSLGPSHDDVGRSLLTVGRVLELLERHDEALESYRRAGVIFERVPGPRSLEEARALDGAGSVLSREGHHADALAQLARARAILDEVAGREDLDLGFHHQRVGEALARAGKHPEAIEQLELALAIFERVDALDPQHAAAALLGLGTSWLSLGRAREAQPPLERALAILEAHPADPRRLAQVRFGLARVLWESRADRPRALVLARAADDGFAGAAGRPRVDAARAWLRHHPR